jgi:hypothetical protein
MRLGMRLRPAAARSSGQVRRPFGSPFFGVKPGTKGARDVSKPRLGQRPGRPQEPRKGLLVAKVRSSRWTPGALQMSSNDCRQLGLAHFD